MKAKTTLNAGKDAPDRPSLYSFNSRGRDAGEVFSILDALEPSVRKSAIWWRVVLGGLVGVLGGALYLVGSDVDVYRHLSPAASNETVLGRTVLKQEAPELQPVSSTASAGDASRARIVLDEPLQRSELSAEEGEQTASAAQPVMANAEVDTGHAIAADSTSGASTVVPAVMATVPTSVITEQTHKEPAPKSARKQDRRMASHSTTATKVVSVSPTSKDNDVDLIAALVAHVSHGEPSRTEIRKNKNKATADSRVSSSGAKRESRGDVSRDIVSRSDGESTAALVARCRSLGLIEGELCRLRICSGLWGIDPACPGTASPDAQSSSGR